MITFRKADERRHERRRKHDVWRTFDARLPGVGPLAELDENRLVPGGGGERQSHRDTEIVTYVHEGALTHEDSTGHSGVVHAGEFERMTAGSGVRHSHTNASRSDRAHVFQVRLRASKSGLEPSREQKRFYAAERRGVLCLVASPDARRGSLRIHADAFMYSALLDRGQHVVHELDPGRSAWLHVVEGKVTVGDICMNTGDGAAFTFERAASMTAQEIAEVLLLDLGEDAASDPSTKRPD